MPNITDAHVLRIKTLIKQGDIEKARTLLKSFDDPRAAKILTQLNAHHPDPNDPIPGQEVEQAKALMAKGDYALAQKMLMVSDDPRADVLLKRINEAQTSLPVAAVVSPAQEKGKAKPKRGGCGLGTVLLVFIVLGVCGALYPSVIKDGKQIMATEEKERKEIARLAFEVACDPYLKDERPDLDANTRSRSCTNESNYLVRTYPAQIETCYFRHEDDDIGDFIGCLFDEGASLSSGFLDLVD